MKYINSSDGMVGFVQLLTFALFEECNRQTKIEISF